MIYFAWQALCELVNQLKGWLFEEGIGTAAEFDVVQYVVPCFLQGESGHVVAKPDALGERLVNAAFEFFPQFRLSDEYQNEGDLGVHLEISEKGNFGQGFVFHHLALVEDEARDFALASVEVPYGTLDLVEQVAFTHFGREIE